MNKSSFEEQFPSFNCEKSIINEYNTGESYEHDLFFHVNDIMRNCLDKARVKKEILNSLLYHENQRKLNIDVSATVAHHHTIIIDFIQNELKERLGLEVE